MLLRYLLIVSLFAFSFSLQAQSTEKKDFTFVTYEASLNRIKTEAVAQAIEADLARLDGVEELELKFLEYHLTLKGIYGSVSPEDLKAVLSAHGAEFTTLETRFIP